MRANRNPSPVVLLITCAFLAACGGGGGGGGGGGDATTGDGSNNDGAAADGGGNDGGGNDGGGNDGGGTTDTTITADNAPAIAGAVYTSVFSIDDVTSFANPLAAGSPTTADARALGTVAAIDPAGEVEDCFPFEGSEPSGQASLTVNDDVILNLIDTGALRPGDTFSLGFADCEEEPGLFIDGMFTLTVQDFEGDFLSDLYLLDAALDMVDFAITVEDTTSTVNADMEMVLDLLSSTTAIITVSGGTIDEQISTGSASSMSDFSITTTIDESGFPDILIKTVGSGALTSSEFDGEIMFNITAAFESMNNDNPFIGTLVITGASGASITLTALDTLTARLTIDLNDGAAAKIIDVPWADLIG